MSRTHNEFVTLYCNVCGSAFHPKYGRELSARHCSNECRYKPYSDRRYILRARISASVRIENGCWIWTGSKNSLGYGFIRVGTHSVRAHRASYEAFREPSLTDYWFATGATALHASTPNTCFWGQTRTTARTWPLKGEREGAAICAERNTRAPS